MNDIEEISPFCIGFTIFQFLTTGVAIYALYKVMSNPLLIISMVIEWFIVAIKSSCSAVYNLPTGLFWLIFCFMFGMAVCGFLIRRYWTGKTLFHDISWESPRKVGGKLAHNVTVNLVIEIMRDFGEKLWHLVRSILATRPFDILQYLRKKFWSL